MSENRPNIPSTWIDRDDAPEMDAQFFREADLSAIIAALMREAVDRAQRKDRARQAATRILERRESAPIVSTAECREARERHRP